MSSRPTPHDIAATARWLPQAVDPNAGLVRLVEVTPDAYRAAAFLDDRLLQQQSLNSHLLPWDEVARSVPADAARDARWIFHIGHVGSTLIARLLGELEGILSVREPRSLRDLTFFPPDVRARFVPALQALLSRTFPGQQSSVVKATSMVSEIAAELVPPGQRALFVHAAPQAYIQGILAGENSRQELRLMAPSRSARLATRGIHLPAADSEAHLAAAAWACEMTSLEAAAEAMPGRSIGLLDFDRFLQDPAHHLVMTANLFEFPESGIDAILAGPLMHRYSKALEYDYSPSLRRQLLAEAGRAHRADIADALRMLDDAARDSPLLARALDRSSRED